MSKELPFFYEISPTVQNYDWGAQSENSYLRNFVKKKYSFLLQDKPMAELWMGAHQKSPSLVLNSKLQGKEDLLTLINNDPIHFLGRKVAKHYNNKLPFLFKLLDIEKPLSVQAHPDKHLAQLLHKQNPTLYPDENHKPELAICLKDFIALVGFRNQEEILHLYLNTPLKELGEVNVDSDLVKVIYSKIMLSESEVLKKITNQFLEILKNSTIDSLRDHWFLKLVKIYGDEDPGVFSVYLFNLYHLEVGEGIYLEPNIPHVYLKGVVLECMADSDNVVRGGLTSKYKDIPVLLSMLNYDKDSIPTQRPIFTNSGYYSYELDVEDFQVLSISNLQNREILLHHFPVILLILEGSVEVEFRRYYPLTKKIWHSGEIYYLPGDLIDREIKVVFKTNKDAVLYAATVNKNT